MITVQYVQMLARYNSWQNRSLMNAASQLSLDERRRDRGAFFKSIARTFNHLLWDDQLWLSRFGGNKRPELTIKADLDIPEDWKTFSNLRMEADNNIEKWAYQVCAEDLSGQTCWYPGGEEFEMRKPTWICVAHLFNHQTHHRGQIHAMLTSAGVAPEATDLPMLK